MILRICLFTKFTAITEILSLTNTIGFYSKSKSAIGFIPRYILDPVGFYNDESTCFVALSMKCRNSELLTSTKNFPGEYSNKFLTVFS